MSAMGYYDEDGNWHSGDPETDPGGAPGTPPPQDEPPVGPPVPVDPTEPENPAPDPGPAPPPVPGTTPPPPPTVGPPPAYRPPTYAPFPNLPNLGPAPEPTLPDFKAPPAFHYDDFHAPSADEAVNDPGYKFRTQQGLDALQRWAAARGTLNDSGTATALIDYGQNAASQEYKNVWDRDFSTYRTNREGAANDYKTNFETQYLDPYKFEYEKGLDLYKPQFEHWKAIADMTGQGYKASLDDILARNREAFQAALDDYNKKYGSWHDTYFD